MITLPKFLLFALMLIGGSLAQDTKQDEEVFVKELNQKHPDKGWKAKIYPQFANLSAEERKRFLGLKVKEPPAGRAKYDDQTGKLLDRGEQIRVKFPDPDPKRQPSDPNSLSEILTRAKRQIPGASQVPIPLQFDARQAWPPCSGMIGTVRDQSSCGSCWAVSTGAAFTDRMCIESVRNGVPIIQSGYDKDINNWMSEADIAQCTYQNYNGCNGGWPSQAWAYLQSSGTVSGSNYVSNNGCKPYPIPPAGYLGYPKTILPYCSQSQYCQTGYPKQYTVDRTHFVKSYNKFAGSDISYNNQAIQREIMANGSVISCYLVYDDFYAYSSGIYKHTSGAYRGGHAVRTIGWGVDPATGQQYWLALNQWGTSWGEGGYFRIARGTDECAWESWETSGGAPKLTYGSVPITEGCKHGWYGSRGNCYRMWNTMVPSDTARAYCAAWGGELASVHDEAENVFIQGLLAHMVPSPAQAPAFVRYFLGMQLTRQTSTGGAITGASNTDSSAVDYASPVGTSPGIAPWATGAAWNGAAEPKATANANCVASVRNSQSPGDWASVPCGAVNQALTGGYVCKQLSTLRVPVKTQCALGWIGLNGKCYKAVDQSADQSAAQMGCQGLGAKLVSITSQELNIFVKGLIARLNPGPVASPSFTRYHIGLTLTRDVSTNRVTGAAWPSGAPVVYGSPTAAGFAAGSIPWTTGAAWGNRVAEPKTVAGANCVSMAKNGMTAGDWVANPCTVVGDGYVCEKGA